MKLVLPGMVANISRSGIRAIVPSSFMISQMTPAGFIPANRARSTATFRLAGSSKDAPFSGPEGKDMARKVLFLGFASSAMAVRMVWARSAALIPVVTPSPVSIDTVKPVSSESGAVLLDHQWKTQFVQTHPA